MSTMPSNFCFDVSPDHVSMRLTSGRFSPRYVVIDDHAANSTNALADRIQGKDLWRTPQDKLRLTIRNGRLRQTSRGQEHRYHSIP